MSKSLGNFFTVRDLIDKGFPERLSDLCFYLHITANRWIGRWKKLIKQILLLGVGMISAEISKMH